MTIDGREYELRDEGPLEKVVYVDGEQSTLRWQFDPTAKSGARRAGPPTEEEQKAFLQSAAEYFARNPKFLEEKQP
jgi:hypothetical protein